MEIMLCMLRPGIRSYHKAEEFSKLNHDSYRVLQTVMVPGNRPVHLGILLSNPARDLCGFEVGRPDMPKARPEALEPMSRTAQVSLLCENVRN
jgi:hypothetical protein